MGKQMRAVLCRDFSGPDHLELGEAPEPQPTEDEILIDVHAASVTYMDLLLISGGYQMRPPTPFVPGTEAAGVVVSVGSKVTRFKPGDEVFGGSKGSFAEYLRVREGGAVAPKPANVSHAQAAAMPIAAVTALQALRDQAQLKPGQKVLVNGASGGVGTYAVQIAKATGAEVTGITSARNIDMVASLGADRVLDYKTADFTAEDARYDVIIDTVGNRDLRDLERVLATRGVAVIIGGSGRDPWIGALSVPIKIMTWGRFADHEFKFFIAGLDPSDLDYLAGLMASGRMKSVIDRTYPLAQVPQAVAYVEEGHARGKVIIAVD